MEVDDGDAPSASRRALNAEELLEEAEREAGDVQLEAVDPRAVRRLAGALSKKASVNLEQRTRHAGEPSRFLESEIELDEAINALQAVAAAPELYPVLVEAGAPETLVSLLSHDNADVAGSVLELLAELVGEDAAEEALDPTLALVAALEAAGLLSALGQRLTSLDERVPEEAAAARAALNVLQALVELDPAASPRVLGATGAWLLGRLTGAGEAGAVDALLRAISPYRKRDAADADEREYVESLFAALCALLIEPAARRDFVEAEGVELMVLVLKGRRPCRLAALRALDFAATECPEAAARLVARGGLGALFGAFMGRVGARGRREEREEEEARAVSLVCTLLCLLPPAEPAFARVAAKFVEAEHEKVDRLMEVLFRHEARVQAGEARLVAREGADPDPDALLLARLDAGLFTLQQCALIAGALWRVGDAGIRRRILTLLHQRARALSTLRDVILGRLEALGDDGG
ncbi:hypothetical protein QBZ16_001376 [Prototheca wickerhamii]|uniref:Beta-catenin-like protein 1 N-terminal domain-containing protein n=1 Tax=Prototheca wickerhamii TaxID=3111 RepID=A0AAD9IG61_PROWI|nr:hypothetical protein QBZ16_001376 [Prototheca wickerhamii]